MKPACRSVDAWAFKLLSLYCRYIVYRFLLIILFCVASHKAISQKAVLSAGDTISSQEYLLLKEITNDGN